MSIAATVGVPIITDIPACIHDGFVAVERLRGVDQMYLFYVLKWSERELRSAGQTGSQSNINTDIVNGLLINLPPEPEQERIAAALTDADRLIASLARLIAKRQAIKQGMMQELLSGGTRLPGYTDPWPEVLLGDLAQIVSGGTPKSSMPGYWDGGIAWCTPTDITKEKGRYLRVTERTISKEGLENSSAQLLPRGSILLCTRATIGELKLASGPIATNQGFKSLVPHVGVSAEFLYYRVLMMKEELASFGTGSTFLEVSKRDVSGLRFIAPNSNEQNAIATVLTEVDDELDAMHARLNKAKAVKEGMMQALLTGRTRLQVEEGAA